MSMNCREEMGWSVEWMRCGMAWALGCWLLGLVGLIPGKAEALPLPMLWLQSGEQCREVLSRVVDESK